MSSEEHKRGMWAGESNILVVVRCRPMTRKEKGSGQTDLLKVLDNKVRMSAVAQLSLDHRLHRELVVSGRGRGA